MTEIQKDLTKIMLKIQKFKKKHGDMYVTFASCENSDHTSVTYGKALDNLNYYHDTGEIYDTKRGFYKWST